MPKKVHLERFFLCFIAHSTNFGQVKAVLRLVDRQQYMVLREAARNILQSTIELEAATLIRLKERKTFIRKLDAGEVSEKELAAHSDVVCELARLTLQYYAINQQMCCVNNGGVDKPDEGKLKGEDYQSKEER